MPYAKRQPLFQTIQAVQPPPLRQELRKTRSNLDPECLLHKEPVDDRVVPKFRYRRNNAHGKLFGKLFSGPISRRKTET